MAEDAQTKVIWRFIGRVLSDPSDPDAVDGREYFYKFADAEGQLRKSGFVEIVTSVAKAMLINSGALDTLIQSAWKLVSSISPSLSASENLQNDVTKRPEYLEFKKQICSKLEDLIPIVAQSLFRFFDVDGSDTISKEEFIAGMTFLKTADFQLSFQPTKLEPSINAVFRLLDQNGDGNIEPAELTSFAVDLINSITNLIGSVIEEFGPYFVKYPLRALFDDIVASKGFGSGLNETIYREEVLASITAALEALDDTIPPMPLEDAVSAFSKGADWSAACELFLAKFEEHHDNGQIPKTLAVKLATDVFMGPALAVITDQLTVVVAAARNQLLELGSRDLDDSILTDAIIQTVGTVRMYVRGGGIKRVLFALFNLLDADNNGVMTRDEVTALWRAGSNMYAFLVAGGSKQDLLPHIKAVLGALWILADADGNGVLSIEELYGVSVKAFDFLLEALEAALHMAKHVLGCVALPAFLLAFDLKAKVLGSSPYEVSVEEVTRICALLGC